MKNDEKCSKQRMWLLLVGFCNAMAHLLTLYSIQMITPALTHVIRGTEPIWMMLFSYLMLQQRSSLYEMISITLMILGIVSIANGGTHEKYKMYHTFIRGIMTTTIANVGIALRNCGSKKYLILTSKVLHYPEICVYSLGWIILLALSQYLVDGSTGKVSVHVLIATLFHVVYSSMSFYVLSFMKPTSHSIVKLVSRTIAVLSLTFAYGIEEPSQGLMFGIFMCIIGGFFYSSSNTYGKMENGTIPKMLTITFLISCWSLACLTISP